ncbi:EAL domain-containing protein [Parashewanella tropica]|uniref:EAL domain-containing protein n=1 Tax=Parashewanella tropica TaxID=2547970 RepID=UPI001059BAA0|nr:EAL domain-containing protein [Parashewanella tropica]
MHFRHICALLLLILSGTIYASDNVVEASPTQPTSTAEQKTDESVSDDESDLIEIPESHIILNTETYGVAEGLSQSTVTSIVEDKDGFLWVGTVNGLNRFDGTEFTHYYAGESGLPSSFIRSLFVDDDGTLWVGTNSGLFQYMARKNKFSEIKLKKSREPIWSITGDKNNLLITTDNYVYKLNKNTKKLLSIFNSKESIGIRKSFEFNDNLYILTYSNNLYSIINDKKTFIDENVNDISKLNNALFFATKEGVFKIENKKKSKISSNTYIKLAKDQHLYGVNQRSIHNLSEKKNIGHFKKTNSSIILFKVKKQSFQIGTIDDGYKSISIKNNLINKTNLAFDSIWGLAKSDHNIYFSSNDSDIEKVNNDLSNKSSINSNIEGYKYLSLFKNRLFIGSKHGLHYIIDGNSTQVLSKKVTSLTSNKNTLLIGTSDGFLYTLDKSLQIKSRQIIKNRPIFDIEEHSNSIYIATESGLFLKIKNNLKTIHPGVVNQICSNKKNIYFSSDNFLFSYSHATKKTQKIIPTEGKLNALYCDNKIILATNYNNVLLFKNKRLMTFGVNSGGQTEYNKSPILKTSDDNFLISGIEGVSQFNLKKINNHINKKIKPKAAISSISVFNKRVEGKNKHFSGSSYNTKTITFNYLDYPFTLRFTSNDNEGRFEYMMKGIDSKWIIANGHNSATYTNIPPGEYLFQVVAFDSLTKERGDINSIKIIITPPWWLSTKAKMGYFIFVLILLILFLKLFQRRREIQKQIALSEERLMLSLWGSGDEMWDWDIRSGKIFRSNVWQSLNFPEIGQRAEGEAQGHNIHPMDRKHVNDMLSEHLNAGTDIFEVPYRVKDIKGNWIWILDRARVVEREDDGSPVRMTGTIKNINDFKRNEEQLKLFGTAIENISEGMFILDADFQFIEVNSACSKIMRCSNENIIGRKLKFTQYPDSFTQQVKHMLTNYGRWTSEVDAIRDDGSIYKMDVSIDTIYDHRGNTSHFVAIFSDVTIKKAQEQEMRQMASTDNLTGLPNRDSLQLTLTSLVTRKARHSLLVLDIDNFKKINDSLGHAFGDELLVQVSLRMTEALDGDATLYRLGGDEFAIVIEKLTDINHIAAVASRIIDTFVQPIALKTHQAVVGASIGIVHYPDDETNEHDLLRSAEIAMYSAKSNGGNSFNFYQESENAGAIRQLEVENLIREALEKNYFEVYYQPKISLSSNKMVGMEALVRLIHPTEGFISPAEFIPIAEETGLIVEIGEIVLSKACNATQKWVEKYGFNGRVAVNLSSRQFALPDLERRITQVLKYSELDSKHLEIEITESTVIQDPVQAIKVMTKLRNMGIHLALDDFGTGYSSLTYLKDFPISTIKIDKSFIDDIDKSDRDLKMVDSIITIAHNMGISVVAEGVEHRSQLIALRALNCEEIQGYFYSKPIPENEYAQFLNKRRIITF